MKKFKFKLQPLVNYKETVERGQKEELRLAQFALRELREEESRLLGAYVDNERSLEEALVRNENVAQVLSEHDAYFRFLRDAVKIVKARIIEAEETVAKCQEKLIFTMRELKTYDKILEEQYSGYLREVKIEEEKNMGDIVSFNVVKRN